MSERPPARGRGAGLGRALHDPKVATGLPVSRTPRPFYSSPSSPAVSSMAALASSKSIRALSRSKSAFLMPA